MARRLSLLAIAVIALCGCGGAGASITAATTGATPSTAPTSSSTAAATNGGGRQLTAAQQQAMQAYRDCMKQNGVNLPAGAGFGGRGQGGGPPSSDAVTPSDTGSTPPSSARPPRTLPPGVDQATYDKAQAACRSKLPSGTFGGGQRRNSPAYQAYLSCLRDNGVPVPTTQTGASSPPPSIDRNAPAFAAADAKCRVLLPTNGSTSPTSASPTSTSQG
jgi:hypothetical protein